MNKVLIISIIAIAAILGIVFLSQSPFWGGKVKEAAAPLLKKGEGYTANLSGEGFKELFSKEVEKRGEEIKTDLAEKKEEVVEDTTNATKKFLAEKILAALGLKAEDLIDPDMCKTSP